MNSGLVAQKLALYDSILTLRPGTTLRDEHIVDLAFVAHKAMKAQVGKDIGVNGPGTKTFRNDLARGGGPTVMTVLVQGQRVFFASSMKGKGLLYDTKPTDIVVPKTQATEKYWKNFKQGVCPAAVEQGLRACGFVVEGTEHEVGHKNAGSCGEVMVAWALCNTLPDAQLIPARVVAVESLNGKMVVKDPCGASPEDASVSIYAYQVSCLRPLTIVQGWIPRGCQSFNKQVGWTVISSQTQAIDVGELDIIAVTHAVYQTDHVREQAA